MTRKKTTIIALLIIVAIMSIGYSLFATRLNINSLGNITSQWNVYFSKIEVGETVGSASSKVTPSVTGTTANMEVNLALPGDSITYELTLTNGGSINAIIENINAKATGTSAIVYTISGIKKGDKLASGGNIEITVKIEYDPSSTSQPVETSKTLTVTIDAVQDIGQSIESSLFPNIEQPLLLSTAILTNEIAKSDTDLYFGSQSSNPTGEGLYYTTDDYGTSYYFRGMVENNYVQFGTYAEDYIKYIGYSPSNSDVYAFYDSLEECQAAEYRNSNCSLFYNNKAGEPMYWRIVRINGDGSVRLIYDGDKLLNNGIYSAAAIGVSTYNTAGVMGADEKYVGYTYDNNGTQVDSTIKGVIDAWYNKHLKSAYGSYIVDAGFCNDKSLQTIESDYVTNGYASIDRLFMYSDPVAPSFKCTNKSDNYTLNNKTGNGLLTNPIGLLTADEAAYAGLAHGPSISTYLNRGLTHTYTMTPAAKEPSVWYYDTALTFTDYLNVGENGFGAWARPVINIKGDLEITGSGLVDDPYIVKTN